MTIEIPLSKTSEKYAGKYVTHIDEADADLSLFAWTAFHSRGRDGVYAIRYVKGKNVSLHRVILSRILGRQLGRREFVDHINHNSLDNRRENLRLASNRQNMQNRGATKANPTGYKGVIKRGNKFHAQITVDGVQNYLGSFNTPEEAHEEYCKAAIKYHGEFVNLG